MLPAWIKRARPRIHSCRHRPVTNSLQSWQRPNRSYSTATHPTSSTAPSSTASSPERILIIGCGISGLSLAHFLQHFSHPPHIPRPHISLIDAQSRTGGWIDTQLPTPARPFLFERGPRSLLTRRGDSTLALVRQLRLQDDVVLADASSKRRYVWDSKAGKRVLLPTGFNSSMIRFPFLGAIVRGAAHEWRTPPLSNDATAECEDESVASFITRRFNRTVAEELIDPLAAGIYTGNIQHLSLRSCFPTLHTAEQQSGSILRHLITAPPVKKEWLEGEEEIQDEEWVRTVKRNGTYSFTGGMRMLTDRLAEEVQVAGQESGQGPVIRSGTKVEGLVLSEAGVTALVDGVEEHYDRVISTVSSKALARILARTTFAQERPDASSDKQRVHLSQPAASLADSSKLQLFDTRSSLSSTALLSSLSSSLSSLPHANVWVVNVAYPPSVLSSPAFGLLCASQHSNDNLLGIAFDSCVFPQQTTAHSAAQPATRLTVMMGGARFPEAAQLTAAAVEEAAVAAVREKLGVVGCEPLWVDARLAVECIPQYVVGHQRWVSGVEAGVEAVNARLDGSGGGGKRRLDVLGSAMYGVSVNDLISRAKLFAAQYYRQSVRMPPDIADTGSEAGILPVAAAT